MLQAIVLIVFFMSLVLPCLAQAPTLPPVVGQDSIHVVAPHEATEDIAHRYGLALEHLAFANGFEIDQYIPEVEPGTPLIIPGRRILPLNPPRDGIVLNIPERGLYLFHHGQFVRFFPVAVGRPHFETPRGQFYIVEKVQNPIWAPPAWAHLKEKIFLPGPNNPLGDRWMGLSAHGVGIHGTVSPAAIGMNVSHGCVRMYPDLARILYDEVAVGTPVRIEYEPVKVGYDRTTRSVCLAVYPDVYGLVNLQERARRLLSASHLSVNALRVETIVSQISGRATPLDVDPLIVKADDIDVACAVAPIRQGTSVWLPLEVLQQAGVGSKPENGTMELTWQDKTTSVTVIEGRPSDPTQGYQWNGHTYVPAGSTLHALGLPYRWMSAVATLWIRPEEPSEASTVSP